ncbi:hypothetical protein B484DRAFT_326659 [Ochromonadaceae sp. CCMP2298]|nr:hypothetical protein B484DRAFT_326659 [Ochromonadaceae sp. CCMP2298]
MKLFLLLLSVVRTGAFTARRASPSSAARRVRAAPEAVRLWERHSSSSSRFALGAARKDFLALDFDGVVCASSGESSVSSIIAANKEWPDFCNIPRDAAKFALISSIVSAVRPVIETGYENMLVVRYLVEDYRGAAGVGGRGLDVQIWRDANTQYILEDWNAHFRDALLARYGSTKEGLIASFGQTRDTMIEEEFPFWVSLNKIYPAVLGSLRTISSDTCVGTKVNPFLDSVFVITTKQERFVRAILENNGFNIFDLDNAYGSKVRVLQELTRRLAASAEQCAQEEQPTLHFVEDRYETLLATLAHKAAHPLSLNVKCYLVDWGYNTPEQRRAARENPEVELISQEEFGALVGRVTGR